ncbi:MAG: OmpA family protein [Bryobacteraceae bacterium]
MRSICVVLGGVIVAGGVWCQPLAPDAKGCADSNILPRAPGCRIDNCEKKDYSRKDVPIRADKNGEPVDLTIEGSFRVTMYECLPAVTPAQVSSYVTNHLRAAGFQLPYVSTLSDALLSARKGDQWAVVEAIAKYYTLTEIQVTPPDPGDIADASGMTDELEKSGHVAIYGVRFGPKGKVLRESEPVLQEVLTLVKDHPGWSLRFEGHTGSAGLPSAGQALSSQEAQAVVDWLESHGAVQKRITVSGHGDAEPVGDNATPQGRAKNQRIEIFRQ